MNLKKDMLLFSGQSTHGDTHTILCTFSGGSWPFPTGWVQRTRLESCSRILSEEKEEVIKHDLVKPG